MYIDDKKIQLLKKQDEQRRAEDWRRQQAKQQNEREGLMSGQKPNYKAILDGAAGRASAIYSRYVSESKATREDPMIPEAGRLFKLGELKDAARRELETLRDRVDVAGLAYVAQSDVARSKAVPMPESEDRQRMERYMMYLGEKIGVHELLDREKDNPEAMAVLRSLAPVLAQAQRPMDRAAANGLVDEIDHIGLELWGDEYREAAEKLQTARDEAYYAKLSVQQALDGVKSGDEPVFVDTQGRVVA